MRAGSFQVPPGNADLYKNGLRKRKNWKNWNQAELGPIFWYLGDQVVWDPLKAHCSIWHFSAKVNIFANEGAILHQDALSFHLSHQPPLYVSIHFLLHELVQLVLILLCKIKSTRTQVVDGSNESLEHADEDLDTLLQKYSPLQKIFKKSSVDINCMA